MTTINGRKYNAKRFSSINEVNKFIESNPEYSVIKVVERDTIYINKQVSIWVAKSKDLGVAC